VTALTVIAVAELVLIAWLIWQQQRAVHALCQRIQAPGAAVIAYDEATREKPPEDYAPPGIEPDDDDGYWLSREKLAEGAMDYETQSVGASD
jgi:hypothetical protein